MAWFEKETEYYQEASGALRQGDLVLAPSAVLESGEGDNPGAAPGNLGEERVPQIWKAIRKALPEAPTLRARVRWDLALVLPHDCALEKEFNERVAELVAMRFSEDAAITDASADANLDRLVAVAPVRSYDEIDVRRREGIRTAQRLGTFPVAASPLYAVEPGWVDLNGPTTIDRRFFSPSLRIASLTDRAADYLRAALARHWAYRDLTRADEVSRAIGRTIVDIKASPMPKQRLRLELLLNDDAGTITLEGSNKPTVPERTARRRI